MLLLEDCRVRLGLGLAVRVELGVAVLEGLGLLLGDGLPCLYTLAPLADPLPTLWVSCCAARTPRDTGTLPVVLLSALSKLLTLTLPLLLTLYGTGFLTGLGRVPNNGEEDRFCPFWELLASIHAFLALVRLG